MSSNSQWERRARGLYNHHPLRFTIRLSGKIPEALTVVLVKTPAPSHQQQTCISHNFSAAGSWVARRGNRTETRHAIPSREWSRCGLLRRPCGSTTSRNDRRRVVWPSGWSSEHANRQISMTVKLLKGLKNVRCMLVALSRSRCHL